MNVPGQVLSVCRTLHKNGFQSYLVGGCVRDTLLGKEPKDWDVATDATPDQVESIFKNTIPTGKRYGTITVRIQDRNIEVTTFRNDGNYSDGRRPDSVTFSDNIIDDLMRRDLTINAMAYDPLKDDLVDPWFGEDDLKKHVIRAVGNPDERFKEDALRMMRVVRFMCTLPGEWSLCGRTHEAMEEKHELIKNVSNERVRDELCRMLTSNDPVVGIALMWDVKLLDIVLPEIKALDGVKQPEKWHSHDVLGHTLGVVKSTKNNLTTRIAALFHDSGKAETRTEDERGVHFYGHERVSARLAREAMTRLKFPNIFIEEVEILILHHMFQFDRSKNKEKTMRKLIAALNEKADIFDLIDLRKADRSSAARGSRFEDYDTTEMEECVRKVLDSGACLKISDMAISGEDIMEVCGIGSGPLVGEVKRRLFKTVLSDPTMNNRDYLMRRALGEYKQVLKESENA